MPARFVDRRVIVTGASAGIGLAAARQFAAEGARVMLVARGADELARAVRAVGPSAVACSADVADPAAQEMLIARALATLGGIDVLVNNAGTNPRGPFDEHDAAALGRAVDVNLRAPIMLTRLALPHLRVRGGAIVNVASLAGRVPLAHEAVYSSTKFGLRAFSLALSEELRGTGVTVSAVSPGPVDTGFIMADLEHVPDIVLSQPMSTADQIAALVLDCAADGRPERTRPRFGAALATLGYVAPGLRRMLRPLLELQGRRNKRRYREQR